MRNLLMGCAAAALTVLSAHTVGRPVGINLQKLPSVAATRSQIGVASWYGSEFQGRPTASGVPFDMHAMTCAHRHLPLGTRIKVTNMANFRSLVLKVNDRGPFVVSRILDVSRGAAKRLGFLRAGLAPVRIQILSPLPHRLISHSNPTAVASAAN